MPMIYFLGVSPGRYQAVLPTFVVGWSAQSLTARIAFGEARAADVRPPPRRRPNAATPSARSSSACTRRRSARACSPPTATAARSATCRATAMDAAHIVADGHEELGQPVIRNGIPLSKIHHAAFDANLIGIDPDGRVHVSERLLAMHDGPMLEQGLKAFAGRTDPAAAAGNR